MPLHKIAKTKFQFFELQPKFQILNFGKLLEKVGL